MKFYKQILTFVIFFTWMGLQAQTLKVGAAVRDITPDQLIPISGGMGAAVMPEGFRGQLSVRAFVLEKGETKIAIVSIDNLGWTSFLGDRSRALIKGIKPQNILIGSTHTHSAPDSYGFPDEKGNTSIDLDYIDWCVVQIADAVNEAIDKLVPASLKIAVGEAKGKIAYNYYAEDLYDPRCGVIQAIAAKGKNKGKPIVTLVNYAIHPEIISTQGKLLSPDLCGPLYDQVEADAGGIAIFMNSAQGGVVTADNRLKNGRKARDWNECIRIGTLLASEALRIIEPAPLQDNPTLFCVAKQIELEVDSEVMKFVLQHSPITKDLDKDYSTVTSTINLLNIGTAQILTVPGEALPNIGYYVKKKMKTKQPFLFGLTNDAYGYILTKEDFDSFNRYKYISRVSLGEMTGEKYVSEALQLINNCPPATNYLTTKHSNDEQ